MDDTTFIIPGEDRYFEDYVPNALHEFGPISVVQDESNPSAKHFASQNTRTGSQSPDGTLFGSLSAGACSVDESLKRLLKDYYLPESGNTSPPEIAELRSIRPVRPGDELIMRVTVTGSQRSSSEPDRGIVHSFIEVQNQDRMAVMSMRTKNVLFCLPK